jgi:hypothetical protein
VDYVIGLGGAADPQRLELMTKKRSLIPNALRQPRPPAAMREAKAMYLTDERQLRSLSSEYNCMGLVFASRRTCIDVGIVDWILREDDYKLVSIDKVRRGDLLVYRNADGPSHVAIVWTHDPDVARAEWRTTVLSQWGADGEYFHDAHDVPLLLGAPDRFWTDRQE